VTTTPPSPVGPITGWLRVEGNKILLPDGRPFHGRGANVHDTRSCDACAWEPPHVEEVTRRIDALVDDWHATFVRLLLESYKDAGAGRRHWRGVLDDDDYFRDVMRIIGHVGKKRGVYVLVSLWHDPTLSPLGWPTAETQKVWKKLASALRDMPFVIFGLVNEPQDNLDGSRDAEVWRAMNDTVAAIRSVERPEHPHVITVQGTREWARVLDYYVDHPITAGGGKNIAYETHVYDPASRFDALVTRPAKKLPVIIGELGVVTREAQMSAKDCSSLMDLAESLEVPWLAYTFHTNCPPNLLVTHENTCGVGVPLEPSDWGRLVKARLAKPW
jgi:endoglucanase